MKKLLIITLLLVSCSSINDLGLFPALEPLPSYTPNPTYTPVLPLPTYTALPTYTVPVIITNTANTLSPALDIPTNTAIPTYTQIPFYTAGPTLSPTLTATAESSLTPTNSPSPISPTETQSGILIVEVTNYKTVLREIKNYNKKGYPIMRIREPRIRFDEGETIEVYAFGGEDDGPLYRADGSDYYYKAYNIGEEGEELYVPSWHVTLIGYPTPEPSSTVTATQSPPTATGTPPAPTATGTLPTPTETATQPTPTPTEDNLSIFVVVTADKTVLRQIGSYNKKGYPIMVIREPRIRYETGDVIQVYAYGGEDDGPLYRTDGADYYYRIFDPDGYEEELYVPSWHVEIISATLLPIYQPKRFS